MIHLIFNRPTGRMKIYEANGSLWDAIDAGGDAWGDGVAPYGHDYPIAPGHYVLLLPQPIEPASNAEGAWQIPVVDMDDATVNALELADIATKTDLGLDIGGIDLALAQLAAYGRGAIMIHGGGSNLAALDPPQNPLAPFQALCKTEGCTRVHNADLARLATFLTPLADGNRLVYSVVGVPIGLPF